MKNGRTGFFSDQMNHFEILSSRKIKSWVTVSWLKMHLFGFNVSAMQFVGVSASMRCFPSLARDPAQWPCRLLGQILLICGEVQWQNWHMNLVEIGESGREPRYGGSSTLQHCSQSSSFCQDGHSWGCHCPVALVSPLLSSHGSHRLCAGIASDLLQLLS